MLRHPYRPILPRRRVAVAAIALLAGLSACTPRSETAMPGQNATPGQAAVLAQAAAADTPAAKPPAETGQPASDAYVIKRVLEIDGPFRHGDYVWDDAGVPDGEIVITVDLKAETLSVFKGGYEIGAAVILFGADEKPTPTGVYPITQKDADHVSNLYGAPMPYMLRMTNDGISVHGSEVDWGYATHGCIGVPVAFAKLLFATVRLGDKIIVTDGETLEAGAAITAA